MTRREGKEEEGREGGGGEGKVLSIKNAPERRKKRGVRWVWGSIRALGGKELKAGEHAPVR